jgi:hypothetical protein
MAILTFSSNVISIVLIRQATEYHRPLRSRRGERGGSILLFSGERPENKNCRSLRDKNDTQVLYFFPSARIAAFYFPPSQREIKKL